MRDISCNYSFLIYCKLYICIYDMVPHVVLIMSNHEKDALKFAGSRSRVNATIYTESLYLEHLFF